VAEWCAAKGTDCVFIDPGSPWQNAWIESFNSRLRDELLNLWQFDSLLEAQVLIGDWRIDHNEHRPHSAHGDLTPNEFARAWTTDPIKQPQAA
jgi:putative transposase